MKLYVSGMILVYTVIFSQIVFAQGVKYDSEIITNQNFNRFLPADNQNNPKYYLIGRVVNNSSETVSSFRIEIVYSDCITDEECIVIARETHSFRENMPWHIGVPVPPGEARDYERALEDIPAARNELRYSVKLTWPADEFRLNVPLP